MGDTRDPLLDVFVFETTQLIDDLEQVMIRAESEKSFDNVIDEIFRIMHTIKGSAAMMMYDGLAHLAHLVEDMFFFLREKKPVNIDNQHITDIVLNSIDAFKDDLAKIQRNVTPSSSNPEIEKSIAEFMKSMKQENSNPPQSQTNGNTKKAKKTVSIVKPEVTEKQGDDIVVDNENKNESQVSQEDVKKLIDINFDSDSEQIVNNDGMKLYEVVVNFEEGCEMEHLRAFSVTHNLEEIGEILECYPTEDTDTFLATEHIRKEGFKVTFKSSYEQEDVLAFIEQTPLASQIQISLIEGEEEDTIDSDFSSAAEPDNTAFTDTDTITSQPKPEAVHKDAPTAGEEGSQPIKQGLISVNVGKLDKLMDLIGELVISESMVTQNPELSGLELDSFHKAARQLKKIINELQDVSMSVRMVPLSITFQKMNRIVRDMSHKLNKEITLKIIGEETEVDKNIIDNITSPLMHLIRNSLDHGIESDPAVRTAAGKPAAGTITLEAKNVGGEIWIIVKDDGRGLNKEAILKKASENGLLYKSDEEMTDKEIYQLIFLPGFSTKEEVSEFSGRGVGMDVVVKSIQKIGGVVLIDSVPGQGTTISIKIPLTLAIMDGMLVRVGESLYVIPITAIRESFRPSDKNAVKEVNGEDIILIRGVCYSVLKLYERYNVETEIVDVDQGIMIMVGHETKSYCLFVDAILGQQQVVVRSMPGYLKKVDGIIGCTLLGDGSISLILDVAELYG